MTVGNELMGLYEHMYDSIGEMNEMSELSILDVHNYYIDKDKEVYD